MDNGQPVKTQATPDFFVPAANGASESLNEVEKGETLDMSVERDLKSIGNNVISLSETKEKLEVGAQNHEQGANLGNVVNMEMPPETKGDQPSVDTAKMAEQTILFNPASLNTKNGLKKDGVREVAKAIDKFKKDGDAAALYDSVCGEEGMVITNLSNSYGENSAWKKAA